LLLKEKQLLKHLLIFICMLATMTVHGQIPPPADSLRADSLKMKETGSKPADDLTKQFDLTDLTHLVFKPKRKDAATKRSPITVMPNIAANPTIGFQVGIKAVAGKRLGTDPSTLFSVAATSASITTKGILYFYVNHNIFTPGNKWNFQGNLVLAKTVSPDFGLGIGHFESGSHDDSVLSNPNRHVYPIHAVYYNIREKAYKHIGGNIFVGAGLAFEIRRNITTNDTTDSGTPMKVYNNRHGFPQEYYSSNGFLFNFQYITRDNPNRAYKGIFFDAGIRINQTWLGSTKNAIQVTSDFRKYLSLSQRVPQFVLAFWNWGSYHIGGEIPYMELPGTARDGTGRSGRAYTSQYFRGTQYNDTELELRFPILKNQFISGVVFGNLQTGNDEQGTRLFQVFQGGYGAGLRILFNKATRTALAVDYAWGNFGNKGFFLNLNETF
jgi:hypothetical protein